ncbi:lysylphosphatidylglycerol synthase transmembrane domain-containing protein [Limosilactobacillus sp.]|uniref:lysylphosphatidylglycerol synthase transmembrane domain-containing protein n=1 Tax=Limosilactobacillus sp. TaxID=2773925 RepID=UPI0025C5D5DB|nr:lysylphosphatidylglycerol synthase transmembrane domain-containing protein [Limosilactobacillus sp.]MCH3923164.1 flippase-like domain-containing protein [Limosilactobacillus sp.]MCH3927847.1 flippase-like domain-containing protein [Limosilactobacillus sp.]
MNRRNWLVLIAMLLVGVGIIAYSLRTVNLHLLMNQINTLNWGWMLVAVLCICLYLGLEGVVVKIFMNERHRDFSWKDALRLPPIEQLFNGITPFSTGGQPAQLVAMLQSGVDGGRASSVLLMKFVVFQAMIVINFLVSLLIGFHFIAARLHALSLLVILGFLIHLSVIVGLLLVMYWYNFTKKAMNILIRPVAIFVKPERYEKMKARLNEMVDSFYQESLKMKKQYKMMGKVCVVTLFQLLFYYLIPYFILLALGVHHLNVVMVVSLHVLIFMIISLFPIPGGAGGAEYSFSVLFASFVHSNTKLVLAMILWRLITYYFGMIAGMVALVVKPDKVHE